MQIQQLFDLIESSQDMLFHFEGVTTPAQLVSRLEILKRQDPITLFEDLESLRMSTASALAANIELGSTLGNDVETDDADDLLKSLEAFPDDETTNTPSDENPKPPETDNAPDKPAA